VGVLQVNRVAGSIQEVELLAENDVLVEMRGIVKDFPGVRALNGVDFQLRKGEVHVLVGENGAGKSTLVKILAGVYGLDQGTIVLNGRQTHVHGPAHAQDIGIAIVYQEPNLVPHLTVAQNISVRHEPLRGGFLVDVRQENERAQEILNRLKLDIDPSVPLGQLSLGQQQMVSFARALSLKPHVLILDEPTSSLAQREIEQMFAAIREIKAEGVGIIYISHRLEELFQIGDRITVLRDGQHIQTMHLKDTDLNTIIRMMVGRDISEMYPREAVTPGQEALRLEGITRKGVCHDINIVARHGEIVGLFGLVGAGRSEMARIVFGLDPRDSGAVYRDGRRVSHLSPDAAARMGLGFVTEDRKREGLCMVLPVRQNVVRASLDRLFPHWLISPGRERQVAHKYIAELSIATPSSERAVAYLSGGNQQKVVLAQWLCAGSDMLILDEPTRGIDVGTKVEIYRMMNRLTQQGTSILMISSELPEVMGMSDRLYVMCRGRITGEYSRGEATAERIVACAFGTQEVRHGEA